MASGRKTIGVVVGTFVALVTLTGRATAQQTQEMDPPKAAIKIGRFTFDPNTSVKDLLPTPPSRMPVVGPVLSDDLDLAPEAEFQARLEKSTTVMSPSDQIAFQLAKIRFANSDKTDGFMTALIESRLDLAGLPFAMGKECRTSPDRSDQLKLESRNIRRNLVLAGCEARLAPSFVEPPGFAGRPIANAKHDIQYLVHYYDNRPARTAEAAPPKPPAPAQPSAREVAEKFWVFYQLQSGGERSQSDLIIRTRIAALMQVLAAESPELRIRLIEFLAKVPHVDATKALARLAIYSPEDDVREAATDALKARPRKDYTDILLTGLRYPWPAVARRSALAIARLDRRDLIPELVAAMAAGDPRLPVPKTIDGKQLFAVRELVKVNHNRNCMLCHAPAPGTDLAAPAPTASIPVPGEPLPSFFEYYRESSSELRIRFNLTYLRQDFSTMLTVEDAGKWPAKQRFDFLVRERTLTVEEARDYASKLAPQPGAASPYKKAALAAIVELVRYGW